MNISSRIRQVSQPQTQRYPGTSHIRRHCTSYPMFQATAMQCHVYRSAECSLRFSSLTSMFLAMVLQYEAHVPGYGSAPRGAPKDVPERLPQAVPTCCRRIDHAAVARSVSPLRPAHTRAGKRCSSPGGTLHQGPVHPTSVPRGYRYRRAVRLLLRTHHRYLRALLKL